MTSPKAPTGRKTTAQGKEPRDTALGPPPPQIPSPEGAGQMPKSWTQIPIEDCLLAYENGRKIRQGWSPQCENYPAETLDDWGVLKTSAIQDGEYVESANKHIPSKLKPRTQLEVEAGDILITCAGPRSRCGVACLVRNTRPKLLISGKMYQLRVDPEIMDRHVLELFLRESGTKKKIDEMKTGISDSGLNLTHSRFATLEIPLPPLAEQRRIVAKIEELFSELDAGEESLRRARRQLGVYRHALLKQAFEGKLTEHWRKQNPDLLESSEQLLSRIHAKRETHYEWQIRGWEIAVEKWVSTEEKGKKPTKPRPPKDSDPIAKGELRHLPELPSAWIYARLSESIVNIDAGKSFSCDERPPSGDEIGVAKVSAVTWGEYDEAECKTCRDAAKIVPEYYIKPGDFLLSRANTIELVGAVVIVKRTTKNVMLSDKTLRIHFAGIESHYILQYLRCRTGRLEIMARSSGNQESMRNIGQDRVGAIITPLCSLPEQREIVRLLDEQFTVIEQNEREIDAALKRSAALRQSILKKAFIGQLVPQDPTDEPASELLERIREERETLGKSGSRKKNATAQLQAE